MITHPIVAERLPEDIRPHLETACAAYGLQIALTTQLKTYPGSTHWHIRKTPDVSAKRTLGVYLPGMIEVTHWPQRGRLWVSVHENRDGGWARAECPRFARTLAAQVDGRVVRDKSV